VYPDKSADAGVFWDGFVAAVVSFIAGRWPFDRAIIYKQAGNGGNLRGEDEGDIIMKDGDHVGPAL